MKRTTIADKLGDIAAAIKQRGSANLTRLTVIQKWFEVPSHLSSFAIFICRSSVQTEDKNHQGSEQANPRGAYFVS
jgi:hypothetical protein